MNALDNASINDENSKGFASFAFPEAKSSKTGVSVKYAPVEDRQWYVLRISSNRVEKANDLVVASRQKHNGMSWSRNGSGVLAIITATMIYGELKGWMTEHRISYRMAS